MEYVNFVQIIVKLVKELSQIVLLVIRVVIFFFKINVFILVLVDTIII